MLIEIVEACKKDVEEHMAEIAAKEDAVEDGLTALEAEKQGGSNWKEAMKQEPCQSRDTSDTATSSRQLHQGER